MHTSPVAPSPALDISQRFAADFAAIGATTDIVAPDRLSLTFATQLEASTASDLLRDAIDGATMVVRSVPQDHATGALPPRDIALGLARDMAAKLPRTNGAGIGAAPDGRHTLAVLTETEADMAHVRALIDDEVLGTPVNFDVIGTVTAESA